MVIIGTGFLGGEGEWRCRKGGRGGPDCGPEGGHVADSGGIEGGAPPWSALGSGASGPRDAGRLSYSSRCLMSGVVGTAGGRCRRNIGPGFRRSGLPKAGCEWGADGALVLVG